MYTPTTQVWNHSFYWKSLSPTGGGEPTGAIKDAIEKKYGSFEDFKKAFSDTAAGHFGSGWAWLVKNPSGDVEVSRCRCSSCDGCIGKA